MPETIIWRSPASVDHLVIMRPGAIPGMATGDCATCGRVHNVGHALTAQTYRANMRPEHQVPCVNVITDWPYDCDAKRKNPGATVYTCTVHSVWWHEAAR